ncbi:UDP-N-acetylmuramoyl-L-alanine--D-glutamate ligase [Saccharibacter sp. 17.LH.SD]|uniref:UDP-N-acetylmuramoyl-L-alanine--D-glutamate ligase n=1 Tax=Saccharibacter sp. 17.LH.SD TaxID=2689393 RepID=UPI00136B1B01|nr:UDP-N-acetylmuramoyl-L-alanine--D-glutamate ligase [Saccharibacter sp. 17.LH.SD]MXV44669.1 UDP-N-acetylmuramoyl-L-alanine--D-glutamate ligase [Saccharibacter sp. 17.LH.SD]
MTALLPSSSWPETLLEGHHYAVCGLGRNGTAVVQALLKMGATVQAWDDQAPNLPDHPNLTLAPITDLRTSEALILSPGIPHQRPTPHPVAVLARSQHVPILSDAELLWQVVRKAGSKARFVSITGTNGKSTTTALLTHILSQGGIPAAAGGNLGTAALALPLLGDNGVYVIEMSSYMLERLQHFHASAAVILNLTPDHMERHGDMEHYLEAKAHVFDHMGSEDLALLGEKAPWSEPLYASLTERHIPVHYIPPHKAFPHEEAPMLPGRHNAQNILTCQAIARHLGLDDATIAEGIRSFQGLEHRLQRIATVTGIQCINDSKATNAEATAHALAAYDKIIWIAGGIAKEGGITSLTSLFPRIAHTLLIGQDGPLLAKTLSHYRVPFTVCSTLEQAVPRAFRRAYDLGSSTIILSPACASFDQFRNFEERGRRFEELVNAFADEQEG